VIAFLDDTMLNRHAALSDTHNGSDECLLKSTHHGQLS
jgi:hypothetical protein